MIQGGHLMKKISFFLGIFICLVTLGCSKQETVEFQSLEDAYFEIAQKIEVKPLKFIELKEMLSNYSYEELVDGNQKIYTFLNENEELIIAESKDNNESRITDILYIKHHNLDSLSIACNSSSDGLDTLVSSLVLNTFDIDLLKTISSKLNQEPSNLFDDYLNISEQMLGDKPLTITEIKESINLEPTLQESGADEIYYSFQDADSGELLGFYATSTSETINQMVYKSNVTGILHNATIVDNSVMFSLSTEGDTLSIQKEVMSLFDK